MSIFEVHYTGWEWVYLEAPIVEVRSDGLFQWFIFRFRESLRFPVKQIVVDQKLKTLNKV